jgi:branched-chain amino acid transport system permease protein
VESSPQPVDAAPPLAGPETPAAPPPRKLYFPRRWVISAGAIVFALVPVLLSPYYTYIATIALIHVLLAVGLNVVLGFTGQLVFANGVLFGVGAYATGLLRVDAGLPFWLALPAGTVIATIIGVAVAMPALRLRGLYLALATIAFAQFALWVFIHWDSVTHGVSGAVIPPVDFSPLTVSAPTAMFYLTFAIVIAGVALVVNLLRSRIGRAFVAIRESERAAEALAIDVRRYKMLAYLVSALYAGLAGGLFGCVVGAVVPDQFNLFQIVLQFCMVLVGGIGFVWGSVIGAVAIIGLQELLRGLQELQELGFGLLLLLTVLFLPGGLCAMLARHVSGWSEDLRGDERRD